jgi:hypothetical protein
MEQAMVALVKVLHIWLYVYVRDICNFPFLLFLSKGGSLISY